MQALELAYFLFAVSSQAENKVQSESACGESRGMGYVQKCLFVFHSSPLWCCFKVSPLPPIDYSRTPWCFTVASPGGFESSSPASHSIPNFQHHSHSLLKANGFQQQQYYKYRRNCLKGMPVRHLEHGTTATSACHDLPVCDMCCSCGIVITPYCRCFVLKHCLWVKIAPES